MPGCDARRRKPRQNYILHRSKSSNVSKPGGSKRYGRKKITIRELIETGKRNGKLTTKEINDAIEETGFDVEQIDKLYETLEGHNVEIVDEPDADSENFTLTENSVDMFENALSAEGVAIDDPVKVYLKEIGRVPLLSGDEEIRLALDILDGNKAIEEKKEKFAKICEIEDDKGALQR